MWEILLLDFFDVGDSAAGLFSSWTNKLHNHAKNAPSEMISHLRVKERGEKVMCKHHLGTWMKVHSSDVAEFGFG